MSATIKDRSYRNRVEAGQRVEPGEALWKVKRVEVLRHGPQKGGYLFYGSAGSFTDATDLIGYGRPNTTIPVTEVK